MPQQPREKRKLMATSCVEIHRGTGRDGSDYVMYEVEAVDEAGKEIGPSTGVALRAFQPLALNELVEYEIQVKTTDKHGTTYTLLPPRVPAWKLVAQLTDRVDALERRLASLEQGGNVRPQSDPQPAPGDAPAPTQAW